MMKPVKTVRAEELLKYLTDAFDMDKKLGIGLSRDEDEVRRLILRKYPELGRAPGAAEIATVLGMPEERVRALLHSLDKKDVLFLKPSGEIGGAYPFRDESGYEVMLEGGRNVTAMCAVDALGIPFMLRRNAVIRSACAFCGGRIQVRIDSGEVTDCRPEGLVVWAGKACSPKAVTSVCETLTFLCSREHAERWRSAAQEGWTLDLPEALYVGKRLFEDALR